MVSDGFPVSDVDLFSHEVLLDPYRSYQVLRDTGPAVFLEKLKAWALPRYLEIRAALKDWQNVTSTQGIAFNPIMNSNTQGMVITTEGTEHDHLRAVLSGRLRLGAVRESAADLDRQSDELVESLVSRGSFDAVQDLARVYPSQVVGNLIGISHEVTKKLFRWGDASFMAVGPLNDRTNAALPVIAELLAFMSSLTTDDFAEGSIGQQLYAAGDKGQIPREMCPLGSGNRDKRQFDEPETFDITRNPRDHLSFGYGVHLCVGAPLARAQLASVLGALLKRVKTFEIGEPTRHFNNVVRSLESLPVTVTAT